MKAKDCIVIGDDIESDIKGATNAGIKSILVKTGKDSNYKCSNDKTQSFPVISNFKAILNII